MRTSLIGPTTYSKPDLWDNSAHEPTQVNGAGQSFFKSSTPRFKSRKGNREDFPVEKEGTSIPHSRGRSRGGGFRELPRPITEGEIAAKLAAASISTWDSFQEAPSLEMLPSSTNTLNDRADAAVHSEVPASKFYQISLSRGPSQVSSVAPSRNGTISTAALGPEAERRGSRSPLRGTADGRKTRAQTAEAGSGSSTPSYRNLKSRMPGFTILAKNVQPSFSAPDYSKAYKRVKLPDGTSAILPVSAPLPVFYYPLLGFIHFGFIRLYSSQPMLRDRHHPWNCLSRSALMATSPPPSTAVSLSSALPLSCSCWATLAR